MNINMRNYLLQVLIIMNFGSMLSKHTPDGKRTVRDIESVSRKIINAEAAVTFNNECIKNNLLPKYTDIRLSNEAVRRSKITLEFRKTLVENETEEKKRTVRDLKERLETEQTRFNDMEMNDELRNSTIETLNRELNHHKCVTTNKIQKKLSNLYGACVPIPEKKEGFINLSKVKLTEEQEEILNLGVNFQFAPRFSPQHKRAELEILYQDVLKLRAQKKIEIDQDFQEALIGESKKNRARENNPCRHACGKLLES